MEGFVEWSFTPWKRRLVARLLAVAPMMSLVAIYGERGADPLLIDSHAQVVLSLQLPFAVIPLGD